MNYSTRYQITQSFTEVAQSSSIYYIPSSSLDITKFINKIGTLFTQIFNGEIISLADETLECTSENCCKIKINDIIIHIYHSGDQNLNSWVYININYYVNDTESAIASKYFYAGINATSKYLVLEVEKFENEDFLVIKNCTSSILSKPYYSPSYGYRNEYLIGLFNATNLLTNQDFIMLGIVDSELDPTFMINGNIVYEISTLIPNSINKQKMIYRDAFIKIKGSGDNQIMGKIKNAYYANVLLDKDSYSINNKVYYNCKNILIAPNPVEE